MRASEFLTELFEPTKKDWEWQFRGSEEATADFNVGNVPYRFHAYSNGENDWEVEFKVRTYDRSETARKTRFGLTGTGNSAQVMSTVVDIMREFLETYRGKIDTIGFTAEEPSRQKLYMRMMKRLLPNWTISTYDAGSGLGFTVVAPDNLEEDNTFSKNRWALIVTDNDKNNWSDNLIDLVHNAYRNTNLGSFVQNSHQVRASDWVAVDWDSDPELDCTVFYRKSRGNEAWSGYKIQGIGHDGQSDSKQKVLARVKNLLSKPGTWIESSDALARTLGKLGLQPVTDEQILNRLFPDSNLRMIDRNGTYERDAGGRRIKEQVFGQPIVK